MIRTLALMIVMAAALLVPGAGCHGHRAGSGPFTIDRHVDRHSTATAGLSGEGLGSLAEATPAVTVTGLAPPLASAMQRKLAAGSGAKGALHVDVTDAPADVPSGDGTYVVTLHVLGLFAHAPQLTKLDGMLTVTLTYTNATTDQLGAELGDVIDDWVTSEKIPAPTPAASAPAAKAVRVAVGGTNCTMHADGSVRCWSSSTERTLVPALAGTTALEAASGYGTCGLRASGQAYCLDAWDHTIALEARDVCGVTTAAQVSVGQATACARLASGEVRCWGRNPDWFAPCDGTHAAVLVDGVTDAVAIDTGPFAGCAITATGGVTCWEHCGAGCKSGVVGEVDATHPKAKRVTGLAHVTAVLAGNGSACGATGTLVKCVALDGKSPATETTVPEPVEQLANVGIGVCARTTQGHVFCWVPTGKRDLRSVPKSTGLTAVVDVAGDVAGACAVGAMGDVWCWREGEAPTHVDDVP